MSKKIAVTAQGIEQIMREAIGIGEKYESMKRAMEWWKKRYRKADAMLEEAGIASRAQAKNFADMKHRAFSAESSLAAMRQRAEEAGRRADLMEMGQAMAKVSSKEAEDARDAAIARAERAESCLRRFQRLADDGVDDPAGTHSVLAHIANEIEAAMSNPPADASTMGRNHVGDTTEMVGERERRLANSLDEILNYSGGKYSREKHIKRSSMPTMGPKI